MRLHLVFLAISGFADTPAVRLVLVLSLMSVASCRDYKQDPGYCGACEHDAAISLPQSAEQLPEAGVASAIGGAGGAAPTAEGTAGTPPRAAGGQGGAAAGMGGDIKAPSNLNPDAGPAETDAGSGASGASGAGSVAGHGVGSAGSPANESGAGGAAVGPLDECARGCPSDKPACNSKRQCVQCTTAQRATCDAMMAVCDPETERCVGCLKSRPTSCPNPLKPVCDESKHECVSCDANDRHVCDATNTQCDVTTHECVGCVENTDCSREKPLCDRSKNACVGCSKALDCKVFEEQFPACDSVSHSCVECTEDGHCTRSEVCDRTLHLCTPAMSVARAKSCEACDRDDACESGACATLEGLTRVCLPRATPDGRCEQIVYRRAVPAGTSTDPTAVVCAPPTGVSCAAIAALGNECVEAAIPTACGLGGECVERRCSYSCSDDRVCMGSFSCRTPSPSGPRPGPQGSYCLPIEQ
jgi:hypothetical protein